MLKKTPPIGSLKNRIALTLAIGLGLCFVSAAVTYWPGKKRGAEAAILSAPVTLVAQREHSPSQGKDAVEGLAPAHVDSAPSELELLNRIRQEIGSPLDSSVFQSPSTEMKGADGPSASFGAAYAKEADSVQVGRERGFVDGTRQPDAPRAEPQAAYRQSLRDAARVLDAGAAHLEDANAFEQADALAQQASDLRDLARQSLAETGQ